MRVIIATHNASAVRRAHNIRDKRVAEKQKHINPDGLNEIWIDETIHRAYHRLFDDAVKEYNAHQDRPERRIKNHLSQIEKDTKKHSCYEMIIGIYPYKDPISGLKEPTPDPVVGKEILRAFVDNWRIRNSNLELIGAYYHADEIGEQPHVHIDYVPVATGYTKGPHTQTGLRRALELMGIEKSGKATSQILWEARENDYLEELCTKRGFQVVHLNEGRAHEDTETYRRRKDAEKYERLEAEMGETEIKAKTIAPGKVVVSKKDLEAIKEQAKGYAANRQEISTIRADKEENKKAEVAIRKKKTELMQRESAVAAREKNADVQTLQNAYKQTAQALEREKNERARLDVRVRMLETENAKQRAEISEWRSFVEILLRVLAWIVKTLFRIDLKELRPREREMIDSTRRHALDTLQEHTEDPQYYLDRALSPEHNTYR